MSMVTLSSYAGSCRAVKFDRNSLATLPNSASTNPSLPPLRLSVSVGRVGDRPLASSLHPHRRPAHLPHPDLSHPRPLLHQQTREGWGLAGAPAGGGGCPGRLEYAEERKAVPKAATRLGTQEFPRDISRIAPRGTCP